MSDAVCTQIPAVASTSTCRSTCAVCGHPADKKCGNCSLVAYCGTEHQRLHWRTHKPTCKSPDHKNFSLCLLDDALLLIFSLLPNEDLVTAGQVCRRWRRLAQRPALWVNRRLERRECRVECEGGLECECPQAGNDDQVLRVLRFAPQLDELDSEFCSMRWPRGYREEHFDVSEFEVPYALERMSIMTAVDIRCLRVYKPGLEFMLRFAASVEELWVTTNTEEVLHVIGAFKSLKRLCLRWDDEGRTGKTMLSVHEQLLAAVAEKQRHSLSFLFGYRQYSGNEESNKRLMEALAQCTNLRALWVPPSPHLKLLSELQLEHLILDLSGELADVANVSVPPSVRKLSVKVAECPPTDSVVQALSRACAGLTALQEVVLRPYCPREDDRCDLQPLVAAMNSGVKVYCHCNCDCYDFSAFEGHEVPFEDRGYGSLFNSAQFVLIDYDGHYVAPNGFEDYDYDDDYDDYDDDLGDFGDGDEELLEDL